jgi:hypothetical protein
MLVLYKTSFFFQGTQKCSQLLLVGIMQNFTTQQQAAIPAIGFGNLLKLKELRIKRNICKEIADAYDLEREEFDINENRVKITLQDVHHILWLPHKGDEITELPKRKVVRLFQKFNWKESDCIALLTLKKELKKIIKTTDEDFVTLFLLNSIGVYLCPTNQPSVRLEYLSLLEDVSKIPKINWSSLVLNHLKSMIKQYKRKASVNLAKNLLLLQVCFSQYF